MDEKVIYKNDFDGDSSFRNKGDYSSSSSSSKELLQEEAQEVSGTGTQLVVAPTQLPSPPLEIVFAIPTAAKQLPPTKCPSKHCSRPGDSVPLIECAYPGCTQQVHYPCYLMLLTKERSKDYTADEGRVVLCTIYRLLWTITRSTRTVTQSGRGHIGRISSHPWLVS